MFENLKIRNREMKFIYQITKNGKLTYIVSDIYKVQPNNILTYITRNRREKNDYTNYLYRLCQKKINSTSF